MINDNILHFLQLWFHEPSSLLSVHGVLIAKIANLTTGVPAGGEKYANYFFGGSQVLRGADCDEVELERDDAGEEAQGERGVQGAPVRVRSQI